MGAGWARAADAEVGAAALWVSLRGPRRSILPLEAGQWPLRTENAPGGAPSTGTALGPGRAIQCRALRFAGAAEVSGIVCDIRAAARTFTPLEWRQVAHACQAIADKGAEPGGGACRRSRGATLRDLGRTIRGGRGGALR